MNGKGMTGEKTGICNSACAGRKIALRLKMGK